MQFLHLFCFKIVFKILELESPFVTVVFMAKEQTAKMEQFHFFIYW